MWRTAGVVALVTLLACAPARAHTVRAGSVSARTPPTEAAVGKAVPERRWARSSCRTAALVDKRGRDRAWRRPVADFSLRRAAADPLSAGDFTLSDVGIGRLVGGGLRLSFELS